MATRKKTTPAKAEKSDDQNQWDPEKVRRFRMAFDKKIKEGNLPKDPRVEWDFEGSSYNMAFAFYLLEYFETVVFWPPQSRVYANQPELKS